MFVYSHWMIPKKKKKKNCEWDDINVMNVETNCQLIIEYSSEAYGSLYYYDKSFDRVNVKNEKPLRDIVHVGFNVTTSLDPVIQKVGFIFLTNITSE